MLFILRFYIKLLIEALLSIKAKLFKLNNIKVITDLAVLNTASKILSNIGIFPSILAYTANIIGKYIS